MLCRIGGFYVKFLYYGNGDFLGYILLYGVCWGTDKTDIEKYKKKIKLNKYTSILFFCGQGMKKYIG